jgi:hypothetical protein
LASLHTTQAWLLNVVSHPGSVQGGVARATQTYPGTTGLVAAGQQLSAEEQLQIYRYMFFERQLEVLDVEFPTVRFLLGPHRFREVTKAYLLAHPSGHASLEQLSRVFAPFLGERTDLPFRELAVSLATVERSMEEVIDAPYDPLLEPDTLTAIPPSQWATLTLRPVRALHLLRLTHPVRTFMDAHRDGRYAPAPTATPAFAAVFRGRDDVVWRAEWPRERFEILQGLVDGLTLGEALETVASAPWADLGLLSGELATWFRRWAEDGLFRAL